ncbi:hypothetical protein DCC81_11730 [Chitinophaga parva]|uniref:Uncharacterized protein n=1 Tax=Chitinophaga parva TaxID=2169414 RepID=A0A2T7BFC3_9BACT|nr:hypothetical protein [Chitinophaga parva]PUZ24979.1 hypothetical protein DCC81_11730 [Chitinophaga parva]
MIKYPATVVYKDIIGLEPVPPAVSILLPCHPTFSSRAELKHRLKIALENTRRLLFKNYTAEMALAVMGRLEKLQLRVNYNIRQQSLALFASPHKSKLFYLDQLVEERIVIGDYFAIRDLVADSKQLRQYLVLILSEQHCQFYLAGETQFTPLKTEIPTDVYAYVNEKPEQVANFSDAGTRREIVMDKFLEHMDQELSHILARYPLPVFILGPEKVVGHFKVHSRHLTQIAGYIHGNYEDAGEQTLRTLIQPCLETWYQHNNKLLLTNLETAADEKKLSVGILEAWTAAWENNAHLLVVERNFHFPARRADTPYHIFREDSPEDNPFCIQDAVDVLIGQVISQGGEVEFLDDGALAQYDHVALIRHY